LFPQQQQRHDTLTVHFWPDFEHVINRLITKRPRDASCLSIGLVSFNTKRRAQSFIVSYIGYRFITAYNQMLFCCLWCNVKTSCHQHFVVVSRHQQTSPLTTSGKCHNLPRSGGAVLLRPSRSQRRQHAMKPGTWYRPRLRIAICAYPTCI